MTAFKTLLRSILPPFATAALKKLRRKGILFTGSYSDWGDALSRSTGYDAEGILERVLSATSKVAKGEAVFERDSVIFNEIEYSWPVTAGLMLASACGAGKLNVLDFGGSLGSSYFQNIKFLNELEEVRWNVVEQDNYVLAGRMHIQNETLRFYPSISDCLESGRPNLVLLSSVLQYIPEPYLLIEQIAKMGSKIIVIDRTPYLKAGLTDMIRIQVVPASIYSASYPCRFFLEENIVEIFNTHGYYLLESFNSLDRLDDLATWKGHIFMRQN